MARTSIFGFLLAAIFFFALVDAGFESFPFRSRVKSRSGGGGGGQARARITIRADGQSEISITTTDGRRTSTPKNTNKTMPLLDRLAAGHTVSPLGPRRFRRFKVWLPWYQAYTRWCFQTRAGKKCERGDCCLWHTECMIDLREQYTLGFQTHKVRRSDLDENWPDGIFGTGHQEERSVYVGSIDQRSLYHRLEVASTRLANALAQVPDCPCVDDTMTLDVTFAICAQNMPGLKGVTRLPRKEYETRQLADDDRRSDLSKSIGIVAEALTAICALIVVASTFVVCRCYYRKSGSGGTTAASSRVPSILRWQYRQQQIIEPPRLRTPPPPPQPRSKKAAQKLKARMKNEKSRAEAKSKSAALLPIVVDSDGSIEANSATIASGLLVIKRRTGTEWAICPQCTRAFETRTGIVCKSKRDLGREGVRYFCSLECLKQ